MAKLTVASPETEKLVKDIATELGLTAMGVEFQAFNIKKAKEMVKVSKASEIAEILSNKETLIIVIVYENAFDRLDDKQKYLTIRRALDVVSYDTEKDKVSLTAPMVNVPLGMYNKMGDIVIQNAELCIHTIQQLEEEEKQKKAEKKALKAKKQKNNY